MQTDAQHAGGEPASKQTADAPTGDRSARGATSGTGPTTAIGTGRAAATGAGGASGGVGSATHPVLALQRSAGNRAVAGVLQRASATRATRAAAGDMQRTGELLAMNLEWVLQGPDVEPDAAAGLPEACRMLVRHVYQVCWDRPFGQRGPRYSAQHLDEELTLARTLLPVAAMYLSMTPGGTAVADRVTAQLNRTSGYITKEEMFARADSDVRLAEQLTSEPVRETRQSALKAVEKGWAAYDKVRDLLEKAGGDTPVALGHIQDGLNAALHVAQALDPESYRTAVAEAREWCAKHHAGAVLGTLKGVQVNTELAELTAGTTVTVATTLSKLAITALKPTGQTLDMLEELAKAGELVSTGGRATLKLQAAVEVLEKCEGALAVLQVASGVAGLITADTTEERVDAGFTVATGALTVGAKLAGRAALGTAATAVYLAWGMVKYVEFIGELGGAAIEGSMWGGLRQELGEIEARGDAVQRDVIALSRALQDGARFLDRDPTDPQANAAREVAEKLAYNLQRSLKAADARWANSTIPALVKAYPMATRGSVAWAGEADFPPDQVLDAGIEFLRALTAAHQQAGLIVVDMLVHQGYLSEEKAAQVRAKLRSASAAPE